jgi:hypothetical protein
MGSANPAVIRDRTSAERSRRYRQRIKLRLANPLAPAAVTTSAPTITPDAASRTSRGILPWLMLVAALAVAGISGFFSITGLTSIFVGSVWAVTCMGASLEFAKIVSVTWLGRCHAVAPRWLKGCVTALVAALMALSSIGSFGFLSKARLARVTAGEATIASHAADVDARKEVAEANLADIDKRIAQVDRAVDEATKRGHTVAAMTLAERQAGRRDELVAERARAADTLAAVEIEGAAVANERAELSADDGPVRYLAALIGADDEKLMRWFVLCVACLLDPLAIAMLWAANTRE